MLNRSSVAAFLAMSMGVFSLPTLGAQQVVRPDSTAGDTTANAQKLAPVRVDARRGRGYAAAPSRTGTKMPAIARDVPQSLVSVTSALINDQGMKGLADVMRYVPGATMGQGEGNRDQVTIRGNNTTADFFVDGVRDDVQYFRDLYNLESVEALKGSNAMVFGRGGGGGVLNRVTKSAHWQTSHSITAEGGSFGGRRISTDLQQSISPMISARLNSVYENSDLYRDGASVERSGVNPTLSIGNASRRTLLSVGYEHFTDRRTADRGIPSFLGEPLTTDPSTFFGNPDESRSTATVDAGQATVSHDAGSLQIRNHTRLARYDKFYQNIFPGAVSADGAKVTISGYNNASNRRNIFNQTDLNWAINTGALRHDLLVGAEVGRQKSDNLRNTAFFGEAASVAVPVTNPRVEAPSSFRHGASDADNGTEVTTASVYLQDQVALTANLRLIGGVRYERFDLKYEDFRTDVTRERVDEMFSPRIGLIAKPAELLSMYASYGVSFLPGSGDQFSSLTDITELLEPERFRNYELGMKWDVRDRLALTAAVYRLDRTNTRSVDPTNSRNIVQTGQQRSQGFELGAMGNVTSRWEIAGGLTRQSARIVSATAASEAGAVVPLVPRTSVALWNKYNFSRRFGAGLGATHATEMFAGIDNKVTLPSYERVDAALFAGIGWGLRAQLNVENILDTRYYPTAHSNNNITPGAPRSARLAITAEF